MELCNLVVRHAGNRDMTIHKTDVPPAEIVLLRALHGVNSVTDVKVVRDSAKRDNAAEIARLKSTYGVKVFALCFPGATPMLPKTLAEADIAITPAMPDDDESEDAEVPASDVVLPAPAAALERARRARTPDLVG